MKMMPRIKGKIAGLTMAAILAASPLTVVWMSMVTGCGGGGCLPPIPCKCAFQFAAGVLAIWLLRGSDGVAGRPGLHCWDLNADGACDPATEDQNSDGICDVNDCQGADGPNAEPIPGVDGLQCWDLNGNGTGDVDEDINGDSLFNALDCRGPAGPSGDDGSDGQDGQDGQAGPPGPPGPELFDWFIEDFFSYGPISEDVSGQGEVINIQEPIMDYTLHGPSFPVGFRTSIPEVYHEGNPFTLRVFLWPGCPEDLETAFCEPFVLDIFRTIPGSGISRYGQRLWLKLDVSVIQTQPGMLVVDLPLNTPEPYGLGFDNDLYAAQMLAFELQPYAMDLCYTILGAEVFESSSIADTMLSNVTVFKSALDLEASCGACNMDWWYEGQCDDGDPGTTDDCFDRFDNSEWGQCTNFVPPVAP